MSTQKTSTTTNQYDPSSMGRYQGWQSMLQPILQNLFQSPYSSQFYQQNLQQNTKGATAIGGRGMQNALLNFGRSGVGGQGGVAGGALQQLLSGAGRFGSNLQYQGWNQAGNQAQNDRWNAASMGTSAFQPFQTGATNVQKSTGVGTWLPQAITAALSIAGAPFTGGASPMGLSALGRGSGSGGDFSNSIGGQQSGNAFTNPGYSFGFAGPGGAGFSGFGSAGDFGGYTSGGGYQLPGMSSGIGNPFGIPGMPQ